jgi:hypothetical protein
MRRIGGAHNSATVFLETHQSIRRFRKLKTTLTTLTVSEYTPGECQALSKGTTLRGTHGNGVLSSTRDAARTNFFGVDINKAIQHTVCSIRRIKNLLKFELALTTEASTLAVFRVLVLWVSTAYFRINVTLKILLMSQREPTKQTGKVFIIGEVNGSSDKPGGKSISHIWS